VELSSQEVLWFVELVMQMNTTFTAVFMCHIQSLTFECNWCHLFMAFSNIL